MSISLIKSQIIKERNLDLIYYSNFFDKKLSNKLFSKLLKNITWKNDTFKIMGKNIVLKRRTAWYGDDGKTYKYSGTVRKPQLWNKDLKSIKSKIEKRTNFIFNSVLLNDYKNGHIGMGFHSDDEKELGSKPVVASLSFGVSRDIYYKNKCNNNLKKIKILIEDGSLLIMKGETQKYWKHSIPIRRKIKERRINLTFRYIY